MGKRGPKPKPTAIRILEGNPGRLPINDAEPKIERGPTMPSVVAMDEIAAVEWERVIECMPAGVFTAADDAVLAQYALAWSVVVRARADIDKHGQLVEEPILEDGAISGYRLKENPAMRSWRAGHAVLMQTSDRLGLNPGQRSRLRVPDAKAPGRFGDLIAS